MKRVVVTGMGIVSCLGQDIQAVLHSLQQGTSGIRFNESYAELGLRSHVSGHIELDKKALIDRKTLRFMGDAAAYAYVSMQQAIEDANLPEDLVSNIRTGVVTGSGGASSRSQIEAADILREKGVKRIGPYRVRKLIGEMSVEIESSVWTSA